MTKTTKEQFFKKFTEDCKDLDNLNPNKMLKEMAHRWNTIPREELNGLTPKEAFGIELTSGRKRGRKPAWKKKHDQMYQEMVGSKDFKNLEEANKTLEEFRQKWNKTPQEDLGGKTPEELFKERYG